MSDIADLSTPNGQGRPEVDENHSGNVLEAVSIDILAIAAPPHRVSWRILTPRWIPPRQKINPTRFKIDFLENSK